MGLLREGDGVSLSHDRFFTSDPYALAGIRLAVADTTNGRSVDRATFLAARPSGKAPWRIMVLPTADMRYCSLVLSTGARDCTRRAKWMRECFSFTKAEIIVAQGLLAGKTAEDIAEDRGASVATIRTHIRHLLEKTSTRRIADLIGLLSNLP